MRTKRFPEMRDIKPDPPKITDESVAVKVANAIYEDINLEDLYWTEGERQSIVDKMASMIIKRESVISLFHFLHRDQPPINCQGHRGAYPFGYEGIQHYPDAMLTFITGGVMEQENRDYNEKYGD